MAEEDDLSIRFTYDGKAGLLTVVRVFLEDIYIEDREHWNYAYFNKVEIELNGANFSQNEKDLFEENIRIWTARHLETSHYDFDTEKNNLRQLYRFHEQQQLYGSSSAWEGFHDDVGLRKTSLFHYEYEYDHYAGGGAASNENWGKEKMYLNSYVEETASNARQVYEAFLTMCNGIYSALKSEINGGIGFQYLLSWPELHPRYLTQKVEWIIYDYNGITFISARSIENVHLRAVVMSQQYTQNTCDLVITINGLQFKLVYEKNRPGIPFQILRDGERQRYRVYFYRLGTYYIEYDNVYYEEQSLSWTMCLQSTDKATSLTIAFPKYNQFVNMFEARLIGPVRDDLDVGGAGAGAADVNIFGADDSSDDEVQYAGKRTYKDLFAKAEEEGRIIDVEAEAPGGNKHKKNKTQGMRPFFVRLRL